MGSVDSFHFTKEKVRAISVLLSSDHARGINHKCLFDKRGILYNTFFFVKALLKKTFDTTTFSSNSFKK